MQCFSHLWVLEGTGEEDGLRREGRADRQLEGSSKYHLSLKPTDSYTKKLQNYD